MVGLGYMKYIEDRGRLSEIAINLGGIEKVLLNRSLIIKTMKKFNESQEKIRELEFDKFANSYVSTFYGFGHPSAGERIRMSNELSTWHHLVNYKEAKKMLTEYLQIVQNQ
ncbi:MAG: hypothetical protein ACP5NZ_00375 [Nanobdellota archaeon]